MRLLNMLKRRSDTVKITDVYVKPINVRKWTYRFIQCINTNCFLYRISYASGVNIIIRLTMDEAGLLTSPNIESNRKFEKILHREFVQYIKNLKNDEETNNE